MALGGHGTIILPWYATGFRANDFEQDLRGVAAVALRYGASSYAVYRAREDRYKFQQLASFERELDWARYWEGPEMIDFRVRHSGWYQVPLLYGWWDLSVSGGVVPEAHDGQQADGNGSGNGARLIEGESV
jgi:hypothetical protein